MTHIQQFLSDWLVFIDDRHTTEEKEELIDIFLKTRIEKPTFSFLETARIIVNLQTIEDLCKMDLQLIEDKALYTVEELRIAKEMIRQKERLISLTYLLKNG